MYGVLNMKFTADFFAVNNRIKHDKDSIKKGQWNYGNICKFCRRFFVTVLENRKKLWFVEVDRCVSCSVFIDKAAKNHSDSNFCLNKQFCSIKI